MEGEVLERELAFHRVVALESLASLRPTSPHVVDRYRQCRNWRFFPKERLFKRIGELVAAYPAPLRIAECGCGDGINSCELALVFPSARLEGFDISPELIAVAQERAVLDRVADRTRFVVADAEKDPLEGCTVDVVLLLNVLHHVDLRATVPSLMRQLSEGGELFVDEPIAYSSTLQRVRDRSGVAKNLSPDERHLSEADIDFVRRVLDHPNVQYYRLLARLSRFLPNANSIDHGHPFTRFLVVSLYRLDAVLVHWFPFLARYCGRVFIHGRLAKP